MYKPVGNQPTPISSLDDLMDGGAADQKPMKVFIGHNLGFRTFQMFVPMHEFFQMSAVANDTSGDPTLVAQRKLNPQHAAKLASYVLKGLVNAAIHRRRDIDKKPVPAAWMQAQEVIGKQPYMSLQPIVVNIRNCDPQGSNIPGTRMTMPDGETAAFKVFLSQQHVLWVVDGQHRRKGMELVFEFLDAVIATGKYPKKNMLFPGDPEESVSVEMMALWNECYSVARAFCTVAVEVHLGLDVDQERQLFHDLNRLGKTVDTSLALQFDSSNPVNLFIKERLITGMGIKVVESDQKDWHNDTGAFSRKDVVAVNAILILNKTNINGAAPAVVLPRVDLAYRFWEAVMAIPGIDEHAAREKTVAAQPVVLKALAKLTFDFAFSNRRAKMANSEDLLEKLLADVTEVDFSHDNPMWRYFELSDSERDTLLPGLRDYLPPPEPGVNRDVGAHQGGFMRFGAKHNDIYPLLGDMIRWKLGLPNRHKE
jgi:hypothetical protein